VSSPSMRLIVRQDNTPHQGQSMEKSQETIV
jgi:hypothetical protein